MRPLRTILPFSLLAGVLGCSGPKTVTAPGAMTALLNQSLARTTAENRALAEVAPLVTLDGIRFKISRSEVGEKLELTQSEETPTPVDTEFRPVPDGWLALVSVARPESVDAAMSQLTTVAAAGEASSDTLPSAMRGAKDAAMRSLLQQTVGESEPGITTGSITMTELDYVIPEALGVEEIAVSVSLRAHVKVEGTTPLGEEDARRIAEEIIEDKSRSGLWAEALGATESFLLKHPTNRKFGVLRAGLQLRLDDVDGATAAVKTTFKNVEWDSALDALAEVEPLVGVDTADRLQELAIDSGVIAPPSFGASPPPSTAVIRDEPKSASKAASAQKKKRKRKRRKRR